MGPQWWEIENKEKANSFGAGSQEVAGDESGGVFLEKPRHFLSLTRWEGKVHRGKWVIAYGCVRGVVWNGIWFSAPEIISNGVCHREEEWLNSFFFFFAWVACGTLVPQPQIQPGPPQWKHQLLTTGLPENSQEWQNSNSKPWEPVLIMHSHIARCGWNWEKAMDSSVYSPGPKLVYFTCYLPGSVRHLS